MIPVSIEGVRRNFTTASPIMYSATLIDENKRRIFVFGIERHEAVPIVAALHGFPLPRPQTVNIMIDTLTLLGWTLQEARIEGYSMVPPLYHLCSCVLRWRSGEEIREEHRRMRVGDVLGLAVLMQAALFVSDELSSQVGVTLPEGETPEHLFARYVLRQEGITLPESKKLRLGYSKTPLRDALVKEFKLALQGKSPPFPEEDVEQRKKDYLTFLLGDGVGQQVRV